MGVVHRDIKPENFLLTDLTDDAKLKAADFGLARWVKHGEARTGVGAGWRPSPARARRRACAKRPPKHLRRPAQRAPEC